MQIQEENCCMLGKFPGAVFPRLTKEKAVKGNVYIVLYKVQTLLNPVAWIEQQNAIYRDNSAYSQSSHWQPLFNNTNR
jgi:hypothetical protein